MPESKRHSREPGVVVREGSVRQARKEAGLTLRQLGGDVVTRQAIQLIEAGKARPSTSVLEQIARATHKPFSFFLEQSSIEAGSAAVAEVERLFVCHNFKGAIDLGERVLATGLGGDLANQASASLWLGAALVATSQPTLALPHLSKARTLSERLGDLWLRVEALDWEACALHLKEDPSALAAAERALLECRSLDPVPPLTLSRILGHIGAIHVARREWSQGLKAYEAALEAAGTQRDLRQAALMNHNLAIAYQRLGMSMQAMAAAQRALALYSLDADKPALARLENDLGDILLKQGRLDLAEEHLRNALASFAEQGIEARGRNYCLLGLAEIAVARNDPQEARTLLDEAAREGRRLGEAIVVACVHQLMGRAALQQGNEIESDAEYQAALQSLEDLQHLERLADCHLEYADVLTRRGLVVEANAHLREGARLARGLPTTREAIGSNEAKAAPAERAS